jgi:hypothetical protein
MRAAMFLKSCALALSAVVGALAPSPAATAREITPAERRVSDYDTKIPACFDPAVLEKIASYFAEKEAKYWESSVTIAGYEKIRPVAWRPWGLDYIPRRFCTGMALLSDGTKRRIDYSVREGLGIIGATWGVDYCVLGHDHNWAYAPACKEARP